MLSAFLAGELRARLVGSRQSVAKQARRLPRKSTGACMGTHVALDDGHTEQYVEVLDPQTTQCSWLDVHPSRLRRGRACALAWPSTRSVAAVASLALTTAAAGERGDVRNPTRASPAFAIACATTPGRATWRRPGHCPTPAPPPAPRRRLPLLRVLHLVRGLTIFDASLVWGATAARSGRAASHGLVVHHHVEVRVRELRNVVGLRLAVDRPVDAQLRPVVAALHHRPVDARHAACGRPLLAPEDGQHGELRAPTASAQECDARVLLLGGCAGGAGSRHHFSLSSSQQVSKIRPAAARAMRLSGRVCCNASTAGTLLAQAQAVVGAVRPAVRPLAGVNSGPIG